MSGQFLHRRGRCGTASFYQLTTVRMGQHLGKADLKAPRTGGHGVARVLLDGPANADVRHPAAIASAAIDSRSMPSSAASSAVPGAR